MRAEVPVLLALPLLTAATTYNLSALFGSVLSPGAEIYYPSDANWTEEVTQRWTTWEAPTYLGAIKPATELDVQDIVCSLALFQGTMSMASEYLHELG
jgi:fumiquinazoline A oxidase